MKHVLKYLLNPRMIPRRLHWNRDRRRDVGGSFTVETWNGTLTVDRADSLIAKGIFVRRSYEQHVIQSAMRWLQRLKLTSHNRDTLLDVGANLGMISIAFLRHAYMARAIAIEPVPENFRLLEHNIRQNSMEDRIAPWQMALSDESDTLTMELDPVNRGAHRVLSTGEMARETTRQRVSVPARTLDQFVADGHCDPGRLGLVWIDVEGHEARFFRGANCLRVAQVPVVMEFSPAFMRASGIPIPEYLATLQSFAGRIVDLRKRRNHPISADEITSLFEQYDRPGKIEATDLLLVPKTQE